MTLPETPQPPSASEDRSGKSEDSGCNSAASQPNRAAEFPLADVADIKGVPSALIFRSKMWWAALACAVLAFWLTWKSIPADGPSIVIHFPDGHGLKVGDAIRHLGIDVGIVQSVELSDDLTQITATITLTPGAAGLGRDGTRFWIVRPQLSMAGARGLETAVGAKYIGVSLGNPTGHRQSIFEGLSTAPPDEDGGGGINIVLRSKVRHGVTVGAPVTWRGVDVGQILSFSLSPDALFVDLNARINSDFTRLLGRESKFWVTSGLDVDMSWKEGVQINADSLSTIVRGGVSFITSFASEDNEPVQPGHLFDLHEKLDPAWMTAASSVPLINFELPPTVTIQGTRRTSFLGISRKQTFLTNGLLVTGKEGGPQILTATDMIVQAVPETGEAESITPHLVKFNIGSSLTDSTVTVSVNKDDNGAETDSVLNDDRPGFTWLSCGQPMGDLPSADSKLLRVPQQPEDCCICRSVKTPTKPSSIMQMISRAHLNVDDNLWTVTADLGDLTPWHGAPVISMQDHKVIGIFVSGKSGPAIAPYRTE